MPWPAALFQTSWFVDEEERMGDADGRSRGRGGEGGDNSVLYNIWCKDEDKRRQGPQPGQEQNRDVWGKWDCMWHLHTLQGQKLWVSCAAYPIVKKTKKNEKKRDNSDKVTLAFTNRADLNKTKQHERHGRFE
jgi:hypothetical protein